MTKREYKQLSDDDEIIVWKAQRTSKGEPVPVEEVFEVEQYIGMTFKARDGYTHDGWACLEVESLPSEHFCSGMVFYFRELRSVKNLKVKEYNNLCQKRSLTT